MRARYLSSAHNENTGDFRGGVRQGSIVCMGMPLKRRTEAPSPLTTHSTLQEPFQPKEIPRKTAPTRSRTALQGTTRHFKGVGSQTILPMYRTPQNAL